MYIYPLYFLDTCTQATSIAFATSKVLYLLPDFQMTGRRYILLSLSRKGATNILDIDIKTKK